MRKHYTRLNCESVYISRSCAKGEADYNSRIVFPSTQGRERHMRLRGILLAIFGIAVVGLTGAALAGGQTAPQGNPLLSDQVFKNVQALKGIPVDDFLETMGIMAAALQFDCSDCHANAGTDRVDWAADTPRKRMERT